MIVALIFLFGITMFTLNMIDVFIAYNSFPTWKLSIELFPNETYCYLSSLLGSFTFLNTLNYAAIFTAVKFLGAIALLIFARGGIPRFRFDYLTKLGWIRFLSLVLLSISVEILLLSLF